MPIQASDIRVRLSAPNASAGNASAGTAGGSLGAFIGTNVLVNNALNNLFPNITFPENAAGLIDYQCLFVHNAHSYQVLRKAKAYLYSEVPGGADATLGVDPTAPSVLTATSPQALEIPDKATAPPGVTFTTTVALGSVPPGSVKAFWVRRAVHNGSALSNDGVTIRVGGETL